MFLCEAYHPRYTNNNINAYIVRRIFESKQIVYWLEVGNNRTTNLYAVDTIYNDRGLIRRGCFNKKYKNVFDFINNIDKLEMMDANNEMYLIQMDTIQDSIHATIGYITRNGKGDNLIVAEYKSRKNDTGSPFTNMYYYIYSYPYFMDPFILREYLR